MADVSSNADKIRAFADAYGIAVRAGVLTPNLEDERAVRKMFGLPDASEAVIAEWARTKGVRLPITLTNNIAADGATALESKNESAQTA